MEWLKDRANQHFSLILGIFFFSQVFIAYSLWRNPMFWDSSIYVAMGKYIFSFQKYGSWEVFRPPLLPFILGIFWKAGLHVPGVYRLASAAISSTALIVFYQGCKDLFGAREAVLTAGIIGSSYIFYFFTVNPLTGILTSIFIFLSVFFVEKENYILAGFTASLAFITRYPAAMIAPALLVRILAESYFESDWRTGIRNSFVYSISFWIIGSATLIFNYISYGGFLTPFKKQLSFTAGTGTSHPLIYYGFQMISSNLLMLFFPIGIYLVARNREWNYAGFLSGLGIFYGFFTYFPLKIPRYTLPFLPLAAVFAAHSIRAADISYSYKDVEIYHLAVVGILMALIMNFGFAYNKYNWPNPEEQKFFDAVSKLEGKVATNDPRTNLYADFSYEPLPPPLLNNILKEKSGEIDYWAINSCYWDCRNRGPNCKKNIQEFEKELNSRYGKSFELKGQACNYIIYSAR